MNDDDIKPGEAVLKLFVEGEKQDYPTLPEEEPIKAHIVSIKNSMGNWQGEEKPEYRIGFRLAEGEGEGLVYSDWLGQPRNGEIHPKSKLYGLVKAVYPNGVPDKFDITDLIGMPVRLELKPPNATGNQYVDRYKAPTKDQKPLDAVDVDEALAIFIGS